jgi:very-short-patch-repair endonuclease
MKFLRSETPSLLRSERVPHAPFDRPWEELYGYAKKMRKTQTQAERLFWDRIKKNSIGVSVRRQAIASGYIADFYIPRASLVIEIDGESHVGREAYDDRRDKWMSGCGHHVLRIDNSEIFRDLDGVIAEVLQLTRSLLSSRKDMSRVYFKAIRKRELKGGAP